jgi:hypothetical protein
VTQCETIKEIHLKCLPYPPYSTDHAICDCCVCGALKEAVGGKTSQFSEGVQNMVTYAARKILFVVRNPGIIEV